MSKNTSIIYWSCVDSDRSLDWNMLYLEPKLLLSELTKQKTKEKAGFFKCPSLNDELKNVFVINNLIKSSYKIHATKIEPRTDAYINAEIPHNPTLKDSIHFKYGLSYIFFSEESEMLMSLTSPYFSQAPHLQYGAIVPGQLDISSWFRNINFEYNLWPNIREFVLEENEPIAYIKFFTKKRVVLKRFLMTEDLIRFSKTTAASSSWYPNVSLAKRYAMFRESKLKNVIFREIQKNIME